MKSEHHFTILVVDDDENDRFFIKEALHAGCSGSIVETVESGNDAIAYLESGPANRTRFPIPDCVIADIVMTEGNGFELLRFMKQNFAFSIIPVFVLSGSTNPRHIQEAYSLGATGYLSKSSDLVATRTKIQALCEFMSACEWVPVDPAKHPQMRRLPVVQIPTLP